MVPPRRMRILMVAADRMEFPGILRHMKEVRSAGVAVDWSRGGRLGEHQVLLAANGAGARRASAAVDAARAGFAADCILSTGFCGALAPELQVGDVVVGTAVDSAWGRFDASKPQSHRAHHMGVVRSIDHVAQSAAEKRQLRATGAAAVEMEAGAVAERAKAHDVPFYCVRVVTDLAGEDMSNDFNAALRPDGHFGTMRILQSALRHPLIRLPELLRLRNRCVHSARVLGDFIADCRF
jgi:adenosylhomocysteine nucleosidase